MINVSYENGFIKLHAGNVDEDNLLASILTDSDSVNVNKSWMVKENDLTWLNKALIPVSDRLHIEPSFRAWKEGLGKIETPATIKSGVVFSSVRGGDKTLPLKDIHSVTRFFVKAAPNIKSYKEGRWDGYINLFNQANGVFPTGLLPDVLAVLTQKGIPFDILYTYDRNPKKQFDWEICDGLTPDPDQVQAIKACVEGKRGICKCPTGYGKTALLAKRLVVEHGVPTLFIANKKSLLDDASREFSDGIKGLGEVAQIKDGWFGKTKLPSDTIEPLDSPIIVATIQSLSARLKDTKTRAYLLAWLQNTCKLVICDESQALGTKTWDDVLNLCKAPYRIGLSATPRRTDGSTIKLIASTGPILYSTSAEEQIKKGRLCELDIYYNKFDHKLYNDFDSDVLYSEAYTAHIVENKDRNEKCIIAPTIEMLEEGRVVLVLIQHIEHGHILKEMFIKDGISPNDIRFIWGDTPDKIRVSAIAEFKKGEFKIMIGSTIFDAGVNVPIISGVVLAGAGNSDITLVQRIGRGARNFDYESFSDSIPEFMRKNHGKKVTKVYDVMDTNIKFFHKQSVNRYFNAGNEFGFSRVHLSDKSLLKKQRKQTSSLEKNIEQFDLQLDMLNEFSDS